MSVVAERSSAEYSKAKRFAATDMYKDIIEKHLKILGNRDGVELDYFKLMPEHLQKYCNRNAILGNIGKKEKLKEEEGNGKAAFTWFN